MRVRFTDVAEAQSRFASIAFLDRDPSSLERFESRLDRVVRLISVFPGAGVAFADGLRRITLSPFPYSLVYEVDDDEILVLAVPHNHQSPRTWFNT